MFIVTASLSFTFTFVDRFFPGLLDFFAAVLRFLSGRAGAIRFVDDVGVRVILDGSVLSGIPVWRSDALVHYTGNTRPP
jgi:hypothetical protein